jgi:hypothetical protein
MPAPAAMPELHAAAPAIPAATPAQWRELSVHAIYQRERENVERRRQLRGLIVLALLVITASIARASLGRVFPHDWWRVW